MFIRNDVTEEMVIDFQLIYDCDCRLNIDFYTLGILKESCLLELDEIYTILDFGLVVCSTKDYLVREKIIDEVANCSKKTYDLFFSIKDEFKVIINECIFFEEQAYIGNFEKSPLKNSLNALIKIMSFRRISQRYLENKNEKIGKFNYSYMPSYLGMLNEAISKLNKNTSECDLRRFVNEYGFLGNFYIRSSSYENYDFLKKEYLKREGEMNLFKAIDFTIKERLDFNSFDEYTSYLISWYEEYRHILQMRVLRNFRMYFEKFNMCIYDTGVEDI